MKLRPVVAIVPMAALALAFAPVTTAADEGGCYLVDDPRGGVDENGDPLQLELCESTEFMVSTNQAKADNIATFGLAEFPTWAPEAPASVTTGAGNGFLGQYQTSLVTGPDTLSGVTFAGDHQGALDSIAVEQYIFTASDQTINSGSYGIVLSVQVGDRTVYESDFVDGDFAAAASGGDAVRVFRFAVTDLLDVAPDAVEGDQEITFNITPYFFGDEGIFVWGAAEAPTNISFNRQDLAGYTRFVAS